MTIPGRSRKKLDQAIASLIGSVRGVEADLGTAGGAKDLIEQVPGTDILVNNLGIYESKNFVDITDDEWLRFFEINLLSVDWLGITSLACFVEIGAASFSYPAKPGRRLIPT